MPEVFRRGRPVALVVVSRDQITPRRSWSRSMERKRAPKLPSPKLWWFSALDHLEEDGADEVLGEDLEEVALVVAVDEDALSHGCSVVFAHARDAVEDGVVVVVVDVQGGDAGGVQPVEAGEQIVATRSAMCWIPGPLYSRRYSSICDLSSLPSLIGMQKLAAR